MIIPGHIGGRMVKWLEEIEVADSESDNHYHFMDNRVLPSHVDEALAKQEGATSLLQLRQFPLPPQGKKLFSQGLFSHQLGTSGPIAEICFVAVHAANVSSNRS